MLMGYKAYVIHVAVVHHQLEAAMSRDGRPGIGEVRAAIIQARREEGGLFETMPPVLFEGKYMTACSAREIKKMAKILASIQRRFLVCDIIMLPVTTKEIFTWKSIRWNRTIRTQMGNP